MFCLLGLVVLFGVCLVIFVLLLIGGLADNLGD